MTQSKGSLRPSASIPIPPSARVEASAPTPGPWEAVKDGDLLLDDWLIRTSHPNPEMRDVTSEADARLIAAAPALLDFAKALDASWAEAFPEGPDGEHRDRIIQMADEHRALWRQCRAAIQSATGEG